MKIALVHDDFCQLGGAERLFEEIARIYPNAPIYTSLVNWDKLPQSVDKRRIHTSFMQRIPFAKKFYKLMLPLYPFAFESFNFDDFDLVLSSTTRFAKAIVTKPQTIHICYINSIPRFLYSQKQHYLSSFWSFILSPYLSWLTNWDKAISKRPDFYIANSKNVQNQIKKTYSSNSGVVYPFVDTDFFKPKKTTNNKSYYLIVTRLVKWKKIEIAIRASNQLGFNLKLVGSGSNESSLRAQSKSNKVEFLSNVTKEELRGLYQNAKALIVTQEEDFGIAQIEAQACGTPVIAYAKGGSTETVVSDKTGLFFKDQTEKSLKDAIIAHSRLKWESDTCRKNALKFSKRLFRENLTSVVESYV